MVSLLEAIQSAQTCSDACWRAREDVCRCQCAGANHGCLRSENGEQPARTSRIQGEMFQLVAVGEEYAMNETLRVVYAALIGAYGVKDHLGYVRLPCDLLTRKKASQSQLDRWPELADARAKVHTEAPIAVPNHILWMRVDWLSKLPDLDNLITNGPAIAQREQAERRAAFEARYL